MTRADGAAGGSAEGAAGAVLVLTAAAGIPQALAQEAARAAGAPFRRLSPDAVEIAGAPESLARARAALAPAPVDANIVPAENRRKKLLIADMDSTIITVECIDELADMAGIKAEVAAVTEAAMRGELDFAASLRARAALLKGLDQDALEKVWRERIRLSPGARALVRTMSAAGARTALVSGGFAFFAERVAAAAGFSTIRANRLIVENGRLAGKVAEPILGRDAKLETLRALAAADGLSPADVLAVGDGANDIAMVEAAGLGVAYRAHAALAARADATLAHSDLTALLRLQGFSDAEIAR